MRYFSYIPLLRFDMAHIRFADPHDIPTILFFIQALAEYEKLSHEVIATEVDLRTSLFGDKPAAQVLICIDNDTPVGFALFFQNYSTFLGRSGIHLEDLFVLPTYRNKGFGTQLLHKVISIGKERGCGRVEWNVLDWNTQAITFYKNMGAQPVSGWTTYRITKDQFHLFPS